MTEPPRRDDVIELLNRLGSDRDEDVLEAAREVHARITAAGMTWEDLLVPDGGAADAAADAADESDADESYEDEDEDEDEDDTEDDDIDDDDTGDTDDGDTDDGDTESPDPEDETTRPTGKAGKKHADSMALIDELLAKSNISADMREELEGYKTDIAAGEFETRDRHYLSAVHKRLSKRR